MPEEGAIRATTPVIIPSSSQAALPSSPPIVPSLADKITAGATLLATNAPVAVAPALAHLAGTQIQGLGIECTIISGFINAVVQGLKQHDWFDQNKLAIWACLVLAGVICFLLWHDQLQTFFLNFMASATTPILSYSPLNKLGVLGAGPDVPGTSAPPPPTPLVTPTAIPIPAPPGGTP